MDTMNQPAAEPSASSGAARPLPRENAGMEYWRVERVARYLDISRKRVYQLVQEKKLAAVKLSPRTLRVLRASIEQYLAELLDGELPSPGA